MPLKPDSLAQQAAELAVLYQMSLLPAGDIVGWADRWVASLDAPKGELIELCLAADDPGGIHRLLDRLAEGADRALAVRRALMEMHGRLRGGAVELPWVLFILSRNSDLLPDKMDAFLSWANIEYELIQDGIKASTVEQLHSAFLDRLNELSQGA